MVNMTPEEVMEMRRKPEPDELSQMDRDIIGATCRLEIGANMTDEERLASYLGLERGVLIDLVVARDAEIAELESHLKADGDAGPDDWVPQPALMAVLKRLEKAEAERDAAVTALRDGGEWRTKLAECVGKLMVAEAERNAALEALRDIVNEEGADYGPDLAFSIARAALNRAKEKP